MIALQRTRRSKSSAVHCSPTEGPVRTGLAIDKRADVPTCGRLFSVSPSLFCSLLLRRSRKERFLRPNVFKYFHTLCFALLLLEKDQLFYFLWRAHSCRENTGGGGASAVVDPSCLLSSLASAFTRTRQNPPLQVLCHLHLQTHLRASPLASAFTKTPGGIPCLLRPDVQRQALAAARCAWKFRCSRHAEEGLFMVQYGSL